MSIERALERATEDWQRSLILEWSRRNPTPKRIGSAEIVPTACTCNKCDGPAMIIPDDTIIPQRGFVLCPQCSELPQAASA